jgi:MOSC domain-containing protein YiiM
VSNSSQSHSLRDGILESVNVGSPQTVTWHGQIITSSIRKGPVAGRVAVRGVNIAGDGQSDRTVHGGPDKALYAYGSEDYEWWSVNLGRELGPGTFGENLTVRGVSPSNAVVGERWRIGSVILEVSQPRLPCYKLGMRMNDAKFPRLFTAAGRPGAYLRIVQEGKLATGDTIEITFRPEHGLTVSEVAHIYVGDKRKADRLLQVPELSAGWHEWARKRRSGRA